MLVVYFLNHYRERDWVAHLKMHPVSYLEFPLNVSFFQLSQLHFCVFYTHIFLIVFAFFSLKVIYILLGFSYNFALFNFICISLWVKLNIWSIRVRQVNIVSLPHSTLSFSVLRIHKSYNVCIKRLSLSDWISSVFSVFLFLLIVFCNNL